MTNSILGSFDNFKMTKFFVNISFECPETASVTSDLYLDLVCTASCRKNDIPSIVQTNHFKVFFPVKKAQLISAQVISEEIPSDTPKFLSILYQIFS